MAAIHSFRPVPSKLNPFDSDEEDENPPPLHFHKPFSRNQDDCSNPFDNQDDCGTGTEQIPDRAHGNDRATYSNPFDSDDDDEEEGKVSSMAPKGKQNLTGSQYGRGGEPAPARARGIHSSMGSECSSPATTHSSLSIQSSDIDIDGWGVIMSGKLRSVSSSRYGGGSAINSPVWRQAPFSNRGSPRVGASSTLADGALDGQEVIRHGKLQSCHEQPYHISASALQRSMSAYQDRAQLLEIQSPYKEISKCNAQSQPAHLEFKSTQELQEYAIAKSEETSESIQNSLKVAEDIKENANRTLVNLHEQRENISSTHNVAFNMDRNLSLGEQLLGSLGGIFSRTWRPKRGQPVIGPLVFADDRTTKGGQFVEERAALRQNLNHHNCRSSGAAELQEGLTSQAKIELEKSKQEDTLLKLSNVLDELKEMSLDMGSELSRQNASLDYFQKDVVSLTDRVENANLRGRYLLRKK